MASPYVIHTYFNQQETVSILNAVVMFCGGDGGMLMLIRSLAILGLICAVCYGIWRARAEEAGMFLIALAIIYGGFLIPRVTVIVEDNSGYSAGAARTVDNVPVGLAFFASATSQIGYWLTNRMETMFSVAGPDLFTGYPDPTLNYTSGGLMAMGRMYRTTMEARIDDPILTQDLISFMRFCIYPELVASQTYVTNLRKSTDIWTQLGGHLNPGRIVPLISGSEYMHCDAAYTHLGSKINAKVTEESGKIAKQLWSKASQYDSDALLASALPGTEALIYTASTDVAAAIKQRAIINLFDDLPMGMSRELNDPVTAMQALSAAQAAAMTNSSYKTMAAIAKETLPLIHNVVQLIILAVFPILILLMVIAGTKGFLVLKSYALTMFWIQLWAPLYAIVNYVATMNAAREMRSVLDGVDGLSISNASALYSTVISGEAVAGMLTIVVPVIALALVKGGEVAMSGAVSSLTQPANAAANQAGAQTGVGNVNMGNVQWGSVTAYNTSAFKSNTSGEFNSGAYTQTGPWGSTRYEQSSGATVSADVAKSNVPFSLTTKDAIDINNALRNSQQGSANISYVSSLSRGLRSSIDESTANKIEESLGRSVVTGKGVRWEKGESEENNYRNLVASESGESRSVAQRYLLGIGAKGSAGPVSADATAAKAWVETLSASRRSGLDKAYAKAQRMAANAIESVAVDEKDSWSKLKMQSTAVSLNKSADATLAQSKGATWSDSAETSQSMGRLFSLTGQVDLTNAAVDFGIGKYGSAAAFVDALGKSRGLAGKEIVNEFMMSLAGESGLLNSGIDIANRPDPTSLKMPGEKFDGAVSQAEAHHDTSSGIVKSDYASNSNVVEAPASNKYPEGNIPEVARAFWGDLVNFQGDQGKIIGDNNRISGVGETIKGGKEENVENTAIDAAYQAFKADSILPNMFTKEVYREGLGYAYRNNAEAKEIMDSAATGNMTAEQGARLNEIMYRSIAKSGDRVANKATGAYYALSDFLAKNAEGAANYVVRQAETAADLIAPRPDADGQGGPRSQLYAQYPQGVSRSEKKDE